MKHKTLAIPAVLSLAAAALFAQAAFQLTGSFAAPGSLPQFDEVWQNQRVIGRPYSATIVTHSAQTFANGIKTEHTETGLVYRDSQGRTRHETQAQSDNGRMQLMVWIIDPVERVQHTLFAPQPEGQGGRGGGAPYYTTSNMNLFAEPGQPVLSPYQAALHTGSKKKKGSPGGSSANTPVVTDLGTQTINGVTAQGVRATNVIPLGAIGNDREISVVTERWVSTDLQVLVKSLNSDPRFGTTTFDLTNIVQSEPDAALFRVPAEYQLRVSKKGSGGVSGHVDFHVQGGGLGTGKK